MNSLLYVVYKKQGKAGVRQKAAWLYFTVILCFCTSLLHAQTSYPVEWADVIGLTVNADNSLTKDNPSSLWTAGAASHNLLGAGEGGWMEFVVTTNTGRYMAGLTHQNSDAGYTRSDNMIYVANLTVTVYESGQAFNPRITAAIGDVFRIERNGPSITYSRNGTVFRTFNNAPAVSMMVDVSVSSGTVPPVTCSFSPFHLEGSIAVPRSDLSNGEASVNGVDGLSPYTYSWSSGESTPAIDEKPQGSYVATVTDVRGTVRKRTYRLGYNIPWVNLQNCAVTSNNALVRTSASGSWNAVAGSVNKLSANTDGWLGFVVDEPAGKQYMIGFSDTNAASPTSTYSINLYTFYVQPNGALFVYEGLQSKGQAGYVHKGDMLRIAREGSLIKYYLNEEEVITPTATDPGKELYARAIPHTGVMPVIETSFDLPTMTVEAAVAGTGYADGTGSIELSVAGAHSPYTYNWTSGEHTRRIGNKTRGTYTVTITDALGNSQQHSYYIGYKQYYTDLVQATDTDGVLTKTTADGWNAGANSANMLAAGKDGSIEFVTGHGGSYAIGFGNNYSIYSTSPAAFKHALIIYNNGTLSHYEGAVGETLGSWKQGDVFRIVRNGTKVTYYQNGNSLLDVPTDSTLELWEKTALFAGSNPRVTTSFDARLIVNATVKGTSHTDGTGSIDLDTEGGTAPYTYLWNTGESNHAISDRSRGAYTVTVKDAEGREQKRTYNLGYRLSYTDFIYSSQSDGVVTKQAGISANWNAAANGISVLPARTNGWIEFVAGQGSTYAIGFLYSTATASINTERNGLAINHLNCIKLYHDQNMSPSNTFEQRGSWRIGDVFRIAREDDSVKYYRNDVLFRSVLTDPKLELLVKVLLFSGSTPLVTTSFDDPLYVPATVRGLDIIDGRGEIKLTPLSGDAPYSYSWTTDAQGDTISNKEKGTYTATVTDAENRVQNYTYRLGYNAYWSTIAGVTDNDHILARPNNGSAWDNSGGISSNQLAAGADGWIEFVAGTGTSNIYIIGFSSTTNAVINQNGFTNGIRLDHPYRYIYVYDGSKTLLIGSWRTGDVFRISRDTGIVRYYQNGTLIYTAASANTAALRVKAAVNSGSIPRVNTSLWVPAGEGAVPDATEFKALKELYDSLGGTSWANKTNWPTGTWPGAVTNDLFGTWFGVMVQGGDIVGLSLPTNNLIGKIPASIGTLARLTSIDFHGNGINGNLTGSVGDLGSLTSLLLGSNQISGAIPVQLSKLGGLQQLSLGDNKLNGKIPTILGGLTNLQLLDLQKNQLSGGIPVSLSGLTSLRTLLLQSNRFTGRVPQELASLGQLVSLNVQDNELTGVSNLSGAANHANLTTDVSQNRISFDDLELNMTGANTHVFQGFTPAPQKPFNEVTKLRIPEHSILKIDARNPGSHGTIVWEWQPAGSSTWSVVTQNEDATQRTLKLSDFPQSKAGLYRYKMTNTWFPGVTLESVAITVEVGGYLVQWMDITPGTTANADGTLTKTSAGGWNAGANSYNLLHAAATGSLEFVVGNGTRDYIVGFSMHNGAFTTESIDYGFSLQADQSLLIWQNSTTGINAGAYKLGDRLKIARNETSIIYYKNDTLISSVPADTARELRVKTALYSGSAPAIVTSFDVQLLLTAAITPTKSYGIAGAITVTPAGGSGSYTYNWSSGEKTPSISGKSTGNYRVTVNDGPQRSVSIPYGLGQQVLWTDLTNVSGGVNQLTKGNSEAWDGGANSTMVLHSGDNGWLEFVVGDNTSTYMVGFASPSGIFNTAAMAYGIAIQEGQRVYAWESAFTGTSIGNWQRGDVFKVARIADKIYYYRNGRELRSVTTDPAAGDLIIKTIIYSGKVGLVQGLLPGNEYNPPALDDATADYTIPDEVKITRDGRMPLPPREQQSFLSAVNQGDIKPLFPTCETGNYIAGFQLYYDLGDRNTSADWSAYVQVTLFHNEVELWTRPLRLKMKDQTFIATAFYDSLISCDGNYYYHIDYKTIEGPVPQDNIFFKILLYKNREDIFNPASMLTLNCINSEADHEKTVSWNYTGKAAIEYDIEWVFIDKYEGFPANGTAQDAFLFKEPVRITTASPYYKHQVYYPTGRLWYRARAVGINPQNPTRHIPGNWFYGTECSGIAIENHEPGLNWQEQTVFAEEGKYKKVMNYFDGSLRQLQVQTNLSSENVTLVGEGMYDYEGRAAINVMAVPATDATLLYKPGFNLFRSSDPLVTDNATSDISKFHYDNYRLTNSVLSDTSGAARYYSAKNESNSIHRDYIPDGKGYVYSQSEYLNDGTGRVIRQSGVGEEFRMDGSHATRYSYGSAAREELVRLFGSNVGDASHYKKNLVVDPNGQVSVSYLDLQDRVIATALAGNSPKNVEALQSYKDIDTTQLTTINIASKNTVKDGLSYTSHKILNVTPETVYTFDYDLSAYASSIVAGCKSCMFDLEITVTDPDGALLNLSAAAGNESPAADPYRYVRRNIKADSCNTPWQVNDVHFQLLFHDIGDYTVTKSLVTRDLTYDEMKELVKDEASVKQRVEELQRIYVPDPEDCAICHTLECPEADSIIDQTIEEIATEDCDNMYRIMEQYYQNKHDSAYRANSIDHEPDPNIYEVSDSLIQTHKDYCQYLKCAKDKPSDIFEKQLVRVLDWETAVQKGYASLIDYDPFFNDPSLSGYGSKGAMQTRLNNVEFATIKGRLYKGALNDALDPDNKNYYVNANGDPDENGRHLLYLDIMGKRDQYTTEEYNARVSNQRWTMYRSFYLEQKRQIKLQLYGDCPKAVEALKAGYEVPDKPEGIPAWAEQHGVTGPVTEIDLNMGVHNLTIACDAEFTAAETQEIRDNLETYLNSNPKNFFRMILHQDVATNPNLIAINNILHNHNCDLDSITYADPLVCKNDTIVHTGGTGGEQTLSGNLIVNPDLDRNPGCGDEITSDCYAGWDKVFFGAGPTTSPSGKTIFMSAKGLCRTPQTVRGTFTSPLVPGKQYKLCFQYWAYNQGEYPGVVDELSVGLSRSTEFSGPDDSCGSPVIEEPDPVTIQGQTESSNLLWYGENLMYGGNSNSDYVDVCVTFTAQEASTLFYAWPYSRNGLQAVVIKNLKIQEVLSDGGNGGGENITVCLEYDQENPTLAGFGFKIDWDLEIQRCMENSAKQDSVLLAYATEKVYEEAISRFYNAYRTDCLGKVREGLAYSYLSKEYHYTLYYYNQAGNLVQTVPPKGVDALDDDAVQRVIAGEVVYPAHGLVTRYIYNSLQQLMKQQTPDAGVSQFWYNTKGQLRLSRNAQQRKDNSYTYTKFDHQERIIETGEMLSPDTVSVLQSASEDMEFPQKEIYPLSDVVKIHYDILANPRWSQANLRGRVSYVEAFGTSGGDTITTGYSYDMHGNVRTLYQKLPNLSMKRSDYVYDLVSGKVKYLLYQYDAEDQYIHQYRYDNDNRIASVLTSHDGFIWDTDAVYRYYRHGPLARVEMGEYKLQGIDYLHTIQGGIKGVNGAIDPGHDGWPESAVPRDAYSYILGYHENDYLGIGLQEQNSFYQLASQQYMSMFGNTGLYNGNIAWMTTEMLKLSQVKRDRRAGMQAMVYRYDQLHRLLFSRSLTGYDGNAGFTERTNSPAPYDEDYDYDANGNLLKLLRYGWDGQVKDNFDYSYYSNSNKLRQMTPVVRNKVYSDVAIDSDQKVYQNIVITGTSYIPSGMEVTLKATESISVSPSFTIGNESKFHAYVLSDDEGMYLYDAIGNLVWDQEEGVKIFWTAYGKVRGTIKGDTTSTMFAYDGGGHRISKMVTSVDTICTTRYIYDASGNVLATYVGGNLRDHSLYGSGRLGVRDGVSKEGHRTLGYKRYELSNHLGNILVVLSDNIYLDKDSAWVKTLKVNDYYPFGLDMENRGYSDEQGYRYGFNGKERDNGEFESTHYDYGFRIYNPRMARFLSVDPLTKSYAMLTPYQFASNTPIQSVDLDGLESLSSFWANFFKIFGIDINVHRQHSSDVEEEAEYQQSMDGARGKFEQTSDKITNLYEGQKSVVSWIPGGSHVYDLFEMNRGKISVEEGVTNMSVNLAVDYLGGKVLGRAIDWAAPALWKAFKVVINDIRVGKNVGVRRNIAFAIGKIDGQDIKLIGVSGTHEIKDFVSVPEEKVYETFKVAGFDRSSDSEVKILESVRQQFVNNKDVTGEITIVSEREFCESCQGVIDQFAKEFKNIRINLVSGVKNAD